MRWFRVSALAYGVWAFLGLTASVYAGYHLHQVLVVHHLCYEHGQMEHGHMQQDQNVALSQDVFTALRHEETIQHQHHVCGVFVYAHALKVFFLRVLQGLSARPPPVHALVLHTIPSFFTQHLWLFAPKNSPPFFF
jgi:hypothetical protein